MAKTHRPDTIVLEDGRFKLQFQPEEFWKHLRETVVAFFDGNPSLNEGKFLKEK